MSRSLMVALLAAGCVTAAAGGSYLAVRQNGALAAAATQPAPLSPEAAVQETESIVEPPEAAPAAAPAPVPPAVEMPAEAPVTRRRSAAAPPARTSGATAPRASPTAVLPAEPVDAGAADPMPITAAGDVRHVPAERTEATDDARSEPLPADPVVETVVIPATAVIGLEIETTVTSERAQVEDRVEARVTRDVFADGRLALPAGSRVIGAVSLVHRGGKVKERARLGIRFHTIVLGDGRQMPLRTEPIYREGESPAAESSRKIGGAAIGGAVLGAILGGGKGAIAGATAGAAGGTAVVLGGDRNPAVLAGGSILTVKLASPLSFDVER